MFERSVSIRRGEGEESNHWSPWEMANHFNKLSWEPKMYLELFVCWKKCTSSQPACHLGGKRDHVHKWLSAKVEQAEVISGVQCGLFELLVCGRTSFLTAVWRHKNEQCHQSQSQLPRSQVRPTLVLAMPGNLGCWGEAWELPQVGVSVRHIKAKEAEQ